MRFNARQAKISIIVPVHNSESTLRECAASLLGQNYSNLQVILVENGSSDKSWDTCLELQQEFPCIEAVRAEEPGVSRARNIGLRQAQGEIIGFCDADDRYLDHCLETVTDSFEKNPSCAVVVTGYRNAKVNGDIRTRSIHGEAVWSFPTLMRHVLVDGRIMGSVWNKFFKREALEGIFFDEGLSLCEDTHFVMHALSRQPAGRAAVTGVCTYEYTENLQSATNSAARLFDSDGEMKYKLALDRIEADLPIKTTTRWLVCRAKYNIARQCNERFELDGSQRDRIRKIMDDNFKYYILTLYAAPVETAKHLVKKALKVHG